MMCAVFPKLSNSGFDRNLTFECTFICLNIGVTIVIKKNSIKNFIKLNTLKLNIMNN